MWPPLESPFSSISRAWPTWVATDMEERGGTNPDWCLLWMWRIMNHAFSLKRKKRQLSKVSCWMCVYYPFLLSRLVGQQLVSPRVSSCCHILVTWAFLFSLMSPDKQEAVDTGRLFSLLLVPACLLPCKEWPNFIYRLAYSQPHLNCAHFSLQLQTCCSQLFVLGLFVCFFFP